MKYFALSAVACTAGSYAGGQRRAAVPLPGMALLCNHTTAAAVSSQPYLAPEADVDDFLKQNGIAAVRKPCMENLGEFMPGSSEISFRTAPGSVEELAVKAHETHHAWEDKKAQMFDREAKSTSPAETWTLRRVEEAASCGFGAYTVAAAAAADAALRAQVLNYAGTLPEVKIAQTLYFTSQEGRLAPPAVSDLKAHYLRDAFIPCLAALHGRPSYDMTHLELAAKAAKRCEMARDDPALGQCGPESSEEFDAFLQDRIYPDLSYDPARENRRLPGTEKVITVQEIRRIDKTAPETLQKIETLEHASDWKKPAAIYTFGNLILSNPL